MFGTLTFLICWGFYCKAKAAIMVPSGTIAYTALWRRFTYTAIATFVYGIIMEYVQRDFIPNRSFDSGDILADGVGSLAGLLFSRFRYIKK